MTAPTVAAIIANLEHLGISVAKGNLDLVPGYADTSIQAHQAPWEPAYVVLHDTGTGIPTGKLKPAQSLEWMIHPGDLAPIRACHFLIGRDGKVHFVYAYACYHAGLGGPYGPNAGTPGDTNVGESVMNPRAFGIEHESSGLSWDLTDLQVTNGAKVAAALLFAMGKGVENALNHKDWTDVTQKDGRTRPGKYAGRKVDTKQPRAWWWKQIVPHLATLHGPTFPPYTGKPIGWFSGQRAQIQTMQRALGVHTSGTYLPLIDGAFRKAIGTWAASHPRAFIADGSKPGVIGPNMYASILTRLQ